MLRCIKTLQRVHFKCIVRNGGWMILFYFNENSYFENDQTLFIYIQILKNILIITVTLILSTKSPLNNFNFIDYQTILTEKNLIWINSPDFNFFINETVCSVALLAHPSNQNEMRTRVLHRPSKTLDVWLCKFVFQINLSSEVKGILSLPSEQRTPEQVQTVYINIYMYLSLYRLCGGRAIYLHEWP